MSKQKLTKLEALFEEPDYGVSSATGHLSKVLRGFWRDIGLTHLHITQLIDKWLDDPDNQFDQDATKINNSRGNIRKDNEKDKTTWSIFLRNLRMLRPKEVRFLIRLRFKNGATYRQVMSMRPPATNKLNSDFIFEEQLWDKEDDDGFIRVDENNYDDEGIRKDEDGYVPRDKCILEHTREGKLYCSREDLLDYLKTVEIKTHTLATEELFDKAIVEIRETWNEEMGNHLRDVANADETKPIVMYKGKVVAGHEWIVRAMLMGLPELKVKEIFNTPELKLLPA